MYNTWYLSVSPDILNIPDIPNIPVIPNMPPIPEIPIMNYYANWLKYFSILSVSFWS